MKKTICALLALAMILTFAACGKSQDVGLSTHRSVHSSQHGTAVQNKACKNCRQP